jgi:glycosyltransferase involved in cell wall biosynthesis
VIGNGPKRLQGETFRIVTVGRLISIKRPMTVLRAFHQVADQASELAFVGDGSLRESLIAESRNLGLWNQVQVTGLVEREAVYRYLTSADLFVSMSAVEGLPISVLEAMACCCPVILSDIPSHREIAAGADFIPLIHPDDIGKLVGEIRRFTRMLSSERIEMGEKCRGIVEERFSLSAMHERYTEIYAQVMAEN